MRANAEWQKYLSVGQHSSLTCKECGQTTLSVNIEYGKIAWICHRASCADYGSLLGLVTGRREAMPEPKSRASPYTGQIFPLTDSDMHWFKERFDIEPLGVVRCPGAYGLYVHTPAGKHKGIILRQPWAGSPLAAEPGAQSAKALTFMDNDEPVMDWTCLHAFHQSGIRDYAAVLVEDQISALKFNQRIREDYKLKASAVALLGTGLNAEKVQELQAFTNHVVLALDKDASGQAFAHARKWGCAFASFRVMLLDKDIKDSSPEELNGYYDIACSIK